MQLDSLPINLTSGIAGLPFHKPIGIINTQLDKSFTRVMFDPGDKGIAIFRMPRIPRNVVIRMKTGGELDLEEVNGLRTALHALRNELLNSFSGLIQVTSGGDVPNSNLAGRVKVKLGDGTTKTRTIPASQVEAHDGKLWIPRWLAVEKTGAKAFAGAVRLPERAEIRLRAIEDELELQLKVLIEAARPLQDAERQAAPLRQARYELERKQAAEAQVEEQRQRERLALKSAIQKEKSEKRISNLPVHAEDVIVKGRDWTQKKGRLVATDWVITRATVRVSGGRAYIFEGGKKPFWKPLDKITITTPEQGE